MGKCKNCGRKKLFLKLDNLGFCPDCSAMHKRDLELNELKRKAEQVAEQAGNAEA